MKPVAAIVESAFDVDAEVKACRADIEAIREADGRTAKHEKLANESREAARLRRYELGRRLLRIRQAWPERGPKAKGWGEFLAKVGIDDSTAYRYMQEAGGFNSVRETAPDPGPVPRSSNESAANASPEQPTEVVGEDDIDRDTWCTPRWITDAIGRWDLDPCANERSHVDAEHCCMFEALGENGLDISAVQKKLGVKTAKQWWATRAFINPPYSKVMPWIEAYGDTRFCFLLKLDLSTKWFEALIAKCELVLMPRRTRIQFEAPPGVPPEKAVANQFPHALFYARAKDATEAIRALCFPGWFINRG